MLNVEAVSNIELVREEIKIAHDTIEELYPTSRKHARELMQYKARLERRLWELERIYSSH